MGIKTVKYKANSIVYFKGDSPTRVYILKKGSIVTKAKDLKTNEDILTMIKVGEFLGVKNVISNEPYSETVSTLTDSELVVFYKSDFENFILSNDRIMKQTLVVFSNQLRKIHKDIKDLNDRNDKSENSQKSKGEEEDLFRLGQYFQKENKLEYSSYCFKKYKEIYPSGQFIGIIDNIPMGDDSFSDLNNNNDEDELLLLFQEGENYFQEENYGKAHECFIKVIKVGGDNSIDATYLNGVSLYKIGKYKNCIKNFSSFLSTNKSYSKINEVMYYVGSSYKNIGDNEQAKLFFKQILKRAEGQPLAQLAMKELRGLA